MKEFLVELTTAVPAGTEPAEVDRRRALESVRADELISAGHLIRLWWPAGEKRTLGVWRAESEAELREKVLGSLPQFPWMTAVVTSLEPHPKDPGRAGGSL